MLWWTAVPASAESVPAAQAIADFKLDNGLEVVVIPDRRAPVVTHMLWYKVGGADEAPGKSGIAHFFEHLMFKGTKTTPQGEFSLKVAEIGGSENAFTSNDYTAYYQQVSPDALATMMALEADRMRNLILTDEVIGPERDVILEERGSRVENDPGSLLSEEIDATLYQNHPYRIPVIGWLHEIEQLNRLDATAFYDRFYAPNNAVLVVAGDVDAATVRTLAEATYGQVPRGPVLPPRVRPREPEQNTARTVTLRDARVSQPSYQRSWVVPSYTSGTREGLAGESEALDLLSEILGGGLRSRLHQELVVKQGIASSAGAYYQGTTLDDTDITVYGSPRGSATLKDVETAVDAEIARLIAEGVTDAELGRAKNRFLRSLIFARDSQAGMARIYGSTLTTGGTIGDIDAWPERIRAVTAADIQAVAKKYLDASRSVTGYLLPAEGDAG
ncbi:MAG: pitrilysin family protein [Mesorhizobium sp.]|nr:pitrilysin family protein [Mesorhizobium sp.]